MLPPINELSGSNPVLNYIYFYACCSLLASLLVLLLFLQLTCLEVLECLSIIVTCAFPRSGSTPSCLRAVLITGAHFRRWEFAVIVDCSLNHPLKTVFSLSGKPCPTWCAETWGWSKVPVSSKTPCTLCYWR